MRMLFKLLKNIDKNILIILSVFFIFLIPLYPKIPLINVNYTYIAIRLEDLFMVVYVSVFIIQLLRNKVKLNKHFAIPFFIFWIAILLSFLSGVYITETIDYPKIGFLHSIRRIEYMIVFLIVSSSIKKLGDFKLYFFSLLSSVFLVSIYGLGQRLLDFPAVSTMNPEFAKGIILFLTPEARLASTFAGHYDLAAYLVFIIPILWGLYIVLANRSNKSTSPKPGCLSPMLNIFGFFIKKIPQSFGKYIEKQKNKIDLGNYNLKAGGITFIISAAVLSILILSYSIKTVEFSILSTLTISLILLIFMSYRFSRIFVITIITVSLLVLIQTASRTSFIAYMVSTPIMLIVLRKYKYAIIIITISVFLSIANQNLSSRFLQTFQVKQFLVNELTGEIFVLQKNKKDRLPAGSQIVKKLKTKKSSDSAEVNAAREKFLRNATASGSQKDASRAAGYYEVSGIAPDISFATRLQIEWPRAIDAFKKNPLLGTGPSSITESTDNDYLRWLGEIGLLGFSSFIYILAILIYSAYKKALLLDIRACPLYIGFIFGIFGLMINALYIDVFEASKVAYTFWFVSGSFAGLYNLKGKN